ncbi:hypothetical protein CJU90_0327 [Yarrowia sp. C11]|nr:hypothetical protein CKK34_1738 [Yarrowia sp. E02]KAG5372677.1 hypothetical protein CJU90_0327 [Yarrowia sp. C11]
MKAKLPKPRQFTPFKKKSLWTSLAAAEQIAPTTQRFGQHDTEQRVYQVPGSRVKISVEAVVKPKNTYRNAGQLSSSQILQQFFQRREEKKFRRSPPLLFNVANPVGQAARKNTSMKPNSPQTRAFSTQSTVWAQKPLPSIFSNPMVSRNNSNNNNSNSNFAKKRPPVDKNKKGKPPVGNNSQFGFNALGNGAPKQPQRPQKQFQQKFEPRVREKAPPVRDDREMLTEFLKEHTPALTSYTIQAVMEVHDELKELVDTKVNDNTKVIYVSESGDIAGDTVDFKVLIKNPKLDLANKSLKLVKQSPPMVKTQSLPSYITPKYQLDNLTKEEKAALKAEYKAQRKEAKAEEKRKKKAIENNRNLLEIHSTWSINLRDLRQQKFRKLAETLKEGRPAVVSFASKNVRKAFDAKRPIDPELLTEIDRERRQLLVEEVRLLAEECKVTLNVSGQLDLLMTMTLKP